VRPALAFRLLALTLLLSQALPASAFARVLYACQFSGRVASTCCCKGKQAETERAKGAASDTKLERPACCTLQFDDSGVPAAALLGPWQGDALAVPPSFEPVRIVTQFHDGDAARFAHPSRGPPGSKVPLYIRHRALLN
jgi:hypothetical protein